MTAGKLTEKIMRQAPSLKLEMVKMMLFVLGILIKEEDTYRDFLSMKLISMQKIILAPNSSLQPEIK